MKTSAIIFAAAIVGAILATTSAMAQQGSVGGKVNLKPVSVSDEIKVGKTHLLHLDNLKVGNYRIGSNFPGNLVSKVGGKIIQEKGGVLIVSPLELHGGPYDVCDLETTITVPLSLTVEKGGEVEIDAVEL